MDLTPEDRQLYEVKKARLDASAPQEWRPIVVAVAILSVILTAELSAAPATLQITLDSCAKAIGVASELTLNASGSVKSLDGYWKAVTVGATAIVEDSKTGSLREFQTQLGIIDIQPGPPKLFSGGFGGAPVLSSTQTVKSCTWLFAGGTRVVLKPRTLAIETIPVAKDRDCFADLVKARRLKGVESRKQLYDLVQYGCVVVLDPGTVVATPRKFTLTAEGLTFAVTSGTFLAADGTPTFGITLSELLAEGSGPEEERIPADSPTTPTKILGIRPAGASPNVITVK